MALSLLAVRTFSELRVAARRFQVGLDNIITTIKAVAVAAAVLTLN